MKSNQNVCVCECVFRLWLHPVVNTHHLSQSTRRKSLHAWECGSHSSKAVSLVHFCLCKEGKPKKPGCAGQSWTAHEAHRVCSGKFCSCKHKLVYLYLPALFLTLSQKEKEKNTVNGRNQNVFQISCYPLIFFQLGQPQVFYYSKYGNTSKERPS